MQSSRTRTRSPSPGVVTKHARTCASGQGKRCSCEPGYQAWSYDRRSSKKIYKTFPSLVEAKRWRSSSQVAVATGAKRARESMTLRGAAEELLAGMADGSIVNRSGERYKPSVVRAYELSLRLHVLDDLGARRLDDLDAGDLQRLAENLRRKTNSASGRPLDASTVRNALNPVRAIYRRALLLGRASINPTAGLQLPAVRGRRDRVAEPAEATALIGALANRDRPLWTCAFYGGLRRGELQALRWEDVDVAKGQLRVERSWDAKEGVVEPKSSAGRRAVPMPAVLREALAEHHTQSAWAHGLVFGRTPEAAFTTKAAQTRADRAWSAVGMQRITFHEARHTYATFMAGAGVSAKELQTFMGHASITITLDRCAHLFPSAHDGAARALDAYIERANTASRVAQL
jgi:integrase